MNPSISLRARTGSIPNLSIIEIDAPLGRDVLPDVRAVLYALRIQIVRTHAQATLDRLVEELEIVEFDGAPVNARRRQEVERVLARELGAATGPWIHKTRGLHEVSMQLTVN